MYNTSSVLECKVGKSPNITQTHSKANTGQDELYWVRPLGSLQYDRRTINWLLDYCGVFFYSNTSVVPPQPLLWPPLNIMFIITFFFLLSFSKWADDFCMIVLLKFCSVEDWLADVDLGVTARYLLLILVLMGKISDIAGIASVDEKICYLVNNYDMVTVYFVDGIIIVLRK